ncbi:expressed unknown protein [Seminavis robusta]|uniref:PARP catalytic domain-containing protein n=1 Tax=Seminavis robusta TaxID=568900 RepID=A0A9N8DF75_9STRA|nr:expressed unknown protein [Seminavis robusta]|eukprot:Sro60_g034680.1 n/a (220) ;mRNA; r:70050-70709
MAEDQSLDAAGTGCWVSHRRGDLGGIDEITLQFQRVCESPEFLERLRVKGFVEPTFHRNEELVWGNPCFDKFRCAASYKKPSTRLGLVFHGTDQHNLSSILKTGLSPGTRSKQAYGRGEYFAKDPILANKYARGALQLLVFVVVLPPQKEHCPNVIVVVSQNDHQLPIGKVTFQCFNSMKSKQTTPVHLTAFLLLSAVMIMALVAPDFELGKALLLLSP